jgi:hypothetical protein
LRQEDGSPVGNIAALKDLYAAEVADYNVRLQAFKEKKKDLDYMDDLIERTTARRIKTYTTTATNVREALKLLKEHLRADKAITTMTLERRWDTLRTQDLGRSKLTTWAHEIQDTYAQLKEMNSGLVQGWKPYADVLDKIKTISRATASTYRAKLEDWTRENEDKQKDRSFLSFVDELLRAILADTAGQGHAGSLFASYQGQGEPDDEGETTKTTTKKKCNSCGSPRHDTPHCRLTANVLRPGTYPNLQVYNKTKEKIEKWLGKGQNRQLALGHLDAATKTQTDASTTKSVKFSETSKIHGSAGSICSIATTGSTGAIRSIATTTDKGSVGATCSAATTTDKGSVGATCSAATTTYKAGQLRKSVIFDSGANTYICNDFSRYDSFEPFAADDIWQVEAGGTLARVLGTGVMKVEATDDIGLKGTVFVRNVLYMPGHHTSIVSKSIWRQKGWYLDDKDGFIRFRKDNEIFCKVFSIQGLDLLEYNPPDPTDDYGTEASVFATNAVNDRPLVSVADADIWHQRLGHAGPDVLEQCVQRSLGVRIKGPTMSECQQCAITKLKKTISRRPQTSRNGEPFGHLVMDIFSMKRAANGHVSFALWVCKNTGFMFVDTIDSHSM